MLRPAHDKETDMPFRPFGVSSGLSISVERRRPLKTPQAPFDRVGPAPSARSWPADDCSPEAAENRECVYCTGPETD